jgi:hypothetical protein
MTEEHLVQKIKQLNSINLKRVIFILFLFSFFFFGQIIHSNVDSSSKPAGSLSAKMLNRG